MATTANTFHELAQHLLEQGRCVFPPVEDGSKRPDGKWKQFQGRLSTKEELAAWYGNGRTSIGLIGGAVSGNLEMFEFEGRAVREGVKDAYLDAARQLGMMPLLERVSRGWSDRSPSGGIHLYYLVTAPVTETTELASRPATEEELAAKPDEKQKLLIETRGEGGYMIIAPSCGRVHPDGPYERLHGGPDSIATITVEEREALLDLARSFDRMPKEEVGPQPSSREGDGLRPGDDFSRRADWSSILKPHGWEYLFTASDGNQYWRRPGRDPRRRGWSATINERGEGVLYVHSTSTGFEARKAYGKFTAYAILNHDKDWTAAAKELKRQGYGEQGGEIRHGTSEEKAEDEPESDEPYALDLDEFVATRLDTSPPLIGSEEDNILPAGGLLLLVAKGGRGKTTLTIDFALHAASGLTWLDFPIQRPLRILLIENEGPREPFRRKLERKRKLWDREMPGRVFIKTANWGAFTADDQEERARLRAFIEQEQIDLVIGDPLGSLGVKGVGSPDDTREFRNLLVQIGLTRDVAFWLLHHPVKGEVEDELDQASGSWGGQMDTQFNLYALPGSRARLSFPKVRWGNVPNRPAAILAFDSESEGFAVVDHEGEKERDLLAEIEELLADGEWRTPREISDSKQPPKTPRQWKPGIGADRKAIEKILEEFPDLFSSCNGGLIGRSPRATFYRCDPVPRTGVEGPTQSLQSTAGEGEKEGTGVLGAGYIETSTQNPVHSPAPVERTQSLHSSPAPAAVIRQQGSGWEVLGPDHRHAAFALTQEMAEDFCREQGWVWELAWGSEQPDRCSCGGPPNHPWPGQPAHCSKCGLEVAS